MGVSDIAAAVLLWSGVAVQLAAAAGLLAGRTVYDRLHFAALASIPGPVLVAAAVGVSEGLSGPTVRTWAAVGFLLAGSPALAAATARAVRAEEHHADPGGQRG